MDTSAPSARSSASADLAIAILTRDRWAEADRCLASIVHQADAAGVPVHLLVNGSTDDTVDRARAAYPTVQIHITDTNLGCPGGRNHLMARLDAEWVAHIDDDGTVGPDYVATALEEIAAAPPDRAVITGFIVDVNVNPDPPRRSRRAGSFLGGICILRTSMFTALGGYPDGGYRQGEENDLAIRIYDAGLSVWQAADLIIYHPLTFTTERREELLQTGLRQALLTGVQYAPWWTVVPWVIWKLGVFGKVALALRSPGPYVAGLAEAARQAPSTLRRRSPVSFSSLMAVSGRLNQ